ncbi:hypothetical protein EDC17_101524 [Sphingobacterium alimentarium]|uniref:LVIVD repeat-containing protein n=1 Tax=Sphingobacterium alimentarium TaxID=797292 RepID=A0A4R3VX83_9SPHI|nr:hypothetical protein [Sphingobacterium alimentarium]TCV15128.1 hypothetical protein EDC17_101524 [Sphingobacterium alimentarium]
MNLTKTFLFLGVVISCLFGCDKVDNTSYYKYKLPILEKMANIRLQAVTPIAPQPVNATGKIYIYKDYLFINEPTKGVHIFNNANPSNPIPISFLPISGNVDMAVKDNVLYADNHVDLLVYDLTNPASPSFLKRVEDVFKQNYVNWNGTSKLHVIVGYKDTTVAATSRWPINYDGNFSNGGPNTSAGGNYGQGGSMARFTLANDHLYTVDWSSLNLFDVSDTKNPTFRKNILLGGGIETIFPHKNNLFIGTNTGMIIYSIEDAAAPVKLSTYSHVRACDPVVVNDYYAFVTLRTGNLCPGEVNVLEVVDIKDLTKPTRVKAFTMENPHGLGFADDMLYICEGKFGLKSFDASDVLKIGDRQIEHFKSLNSTDVIPGPKSLIVVGEGGVCQYDYSDKKKIKLLSCIAVTPID